MKLKNLVIVGLGLGSCASAALADTVFTFSNATRNAEVRFAKSGDNLVATLSNTSTLDAMVPTDLLTAVFFDIAGSPQLGRVSAVLKSGSTVNNGSTGNGPVDPLGVVGGEWAYRSGITFPSLYSTWGKQGISSTGLNLFGPGDRFPGNNLSGPSSPGGPQFGLTTAGDNPATGNGGLNVPIIQNSVVVTLSGFSTYNLGAISNVRFLYGTDLNEPSFNGAEQANAPLPSAPLPPAAIGGVVLLATGGLNRLRKRHPR